MENLEECIIEIKKAIARIEEQLKTIFNTLSENREAGKDLREKTSSLCRDFDVRISRHDVDIQAINKSLGKMEGLIEEIADNASKARGIALGLGMAGGAIVSILTIVAELIK